MVFEVPNGNLANLDEALTVAEEIGYPIMLKATSGGGGRGIRRCDTAEQLRQAWDRVISEATKAFGSAEVFMEKCVVDPLHIEVQVLADSHGGVIHLFERDCSAQRRHQKILEEAPAPDLDPALREEMGAAAVAAARAVGYVGAGTVAGVANQQPGAGKGQPQAGDQPAARALAAEDPQGCHHHHRRQLAEQGRIGDGGGPDGAMEEEQVGR